MSTIRGQTFTDAQALPGAYVRLPPAANSHLRDGWPLAANFAMRAHNNLSVLALQSCRHLAWWAGNAAPAQKDGWDGLRDASEPDPAEITGDEWDISWSHEVARHFGPFFGIEDRRGARGEGLLRRVTFEVEVANTNLTVYLAITSGLQPLPPYLGYAAFSKKTGASSGVNTWALDVDAPLGAADRIQCRNASSTSGAATVNVPVFWCWVGWLSANAADRVKSISLYEQRD